MKRRLLHLLNILVGVVAVGGFALYAIRMAKTVDMRHLAEGPAVLGIAAMAVASALIIPISAFAWKHLLDSCGVHAHWGGLARIMGVTQLGKYLPGNIAQHIGRLGMSVKAGIPSLPFASTVLSETVLAILAAVVFGTLACVAGGMGSVTLPLGGPTSGFATLPLLLAVAAAALLAVLASARLIRMIARRRMRGETIAVPGTRALLLAFICYITNYVVLSAGVAVLSGVLLPDPPSAWVLTGAFALSWILGFLLPGAPAGLGVRETAMLGILQAAGYGADLLPFVIGLRVATTLGDLLCFVISACATRMLPASPIAPN